MNYLKVSLIAILSIILTLQLCEANAIKSKFYRKKVNYPKYQADNDCRNCSDSNVRKVYYHHIRQPRGVNSDSTTVLEENENNTSSTTITTPQEDIKILDQKYSQNASGEYKHEYTIIYILSKMLMFIGFDFIEFCLAIMPGVQNKVNMKIVMVQPYL